MLLTLLICVLVLYVIQDKFFTKYWHENLSVKLRFSDKYIYEGDSSTLKEIVINNKNMPIPALSIRMAVTRDLEFIQDAKYNTTTSDLTYKRDVFSFISKQQITRKLAFVGKKRGFYHFDNVDVVANNYFFKESSYISLPQDAGIFVYPSQISTQGIQLLCREITGTILSPNRLFPDPFEFYGIREYQKTDPIKYINWKSSARSKALMVNQFDSTTNINIHLLFDIEDSNILKQEDLVEETIRIVSSLAAKLVSSNMPLTIRSNAIDYTSNQSISQYMPAGGGKIAEFNQKLACLDSQKLFFTGQELLSKESKLVSSNSSYIFVSKNLTTANTKAISSLASLCQGILWVIPTHSYDDPIKTEIPGVRLLRWESRI